MKPGDKIHMSPGRDNTEELVKPVDRIRLRYYTGELEKPNDSIYISPGKDKILEN